MKKSISLLLLPLFLLSCSGAPVVTTSEKQDFFVQVQEFWSFWKSVFFEKSGKMQSWQDIKLSSQANWRIRSVAVKEWTKVKQGQPLVYLFDNIANYGISLQRAENLLEKMNINYDSTKLSLNKQIFDAEINVERLSNNLEALRKNVELDIEKAKDSLDNSSYINLDSKSSLELQKIDNSIEKAELDYNNSKINNQETLAGYKSTVKKEHNALLISLADMLEFGDKLFGVSSQYEDEAEDIQDFFGGEDVGQRYTTKQLLTDLMTFKDTTLKNLKVENLSDDELISTIETIWKWYDLAKTYLNELEETINNSIPSEGTLWVSDIQWYVVSVNTYQSSMQWGYTAFLAFDNAAGSFMRTYQNSESSLEKQISLLKKDREIFVKSLESGALNSETWFDKTVTSGEDSIKTLELQLVSAQQTLENAIANRDITLKALQNSIDEAQINLGAANKEYAKLTIVAPIEGVIGDILVDEGQDVNNGTPLLNIVSNKKTEVEIGLQDKELAAVSVGMNVFLDFNWKSYTGSIYSISPIADQNLSYKTNIVFPEKLDLIWGIVKVKLPISSIYTVLPLNAVTVSGNNIGTIHIFQDGKLSAREVKLGNVFGESVEVIGSLDNTPIDKNVWIVLNDLSNYDAEKFNLKVGQ